MLVCQLPAALRRLPRPSSPVIAKASTTCTYSLDPIALSPQGISTPKSPCHRLFLLQRLCRSPPHRYCPMGMGDTYNLNPSTPFQTAKQCGCTSCRIVKERTAPGFVKNQNQANAPIRLVLAFQQPLNSGGGERDRTDDPLLAKQVLSQLSYTPLPVSWWVWLELNQRPPPYQDGALTN
jgi:hypothetical protein